MLDLRDARPGDQYRVYIDADKQMTSTPGLNTILATVVATSETDKSYVLLGWKEGQEMPSNVISRSSTSAGNTYAKRQEEYVFGRTVYRTQKVAIQIINGLDGFPCSRCTNFYAYAVPNRPDGTLLCWSCRDGKK